MSAASIPRSSRRRRRLGAERASASGAYPAAAGAGARDHVLPLLRAGLLGVSFGGAARRAGRADARDLDRGLSGRVRGFRLFPMASAIAMIMAGAQLVVIAVVMGAARAFLSRPGERREGLRWLYENARSAKPSGPARCWLFVALFVVNLAARHRDRRRQFALDSLARNLAAAGLDVEMVCLGLGRVLSLADVLRVTFEATFAVVALSGLFGVPAAYAMARRDFPGKRLVMLILLAPLLAPPITYGIPLATVLYQLRPRRHARGRGARQSRAVGALRGAGADPVRRADRSARSRRRRGCSARIRRNCSATS